MIKALTIQVIIFGIFFYVDARQTVAESWRQVLRFGLNPFVIAFFGLAPLALWWSYRVLYQKMQSFWLATILSGCLLQAAYLVSAYLGSRAIPSRGDWIAIAFSTIGTVIGLLVK